MLPYRVTWLGIMVLVVCEQILATQVGTSFSTDDNNIFESSGEVDSEIGHRIRAEDEIEDEEQEREQQAARDVVDKFLSIVEQYEQNKDNCTPGTEFNLGEGVVAQYGVFAYKAQAMVAVNRANFLTRIWKNSPAALLDSEYFFFTAVRSMVEGDDDLFAAGNCYDFMEYKNYTLFCPYAYRLPNVSSEIMVKDLSVEYKYLTNQSEFFWSARLKAENKLKEKYNETHGKYFAFN